MSPGLSANKVISWDFMMGFNGDFSGDSLCDLKKRLYNTLYGIYMGFTWNFIFYWHLYEISMGFKWYSKQDFVGYVVVLKNQLTGI